MNDNTFIKMNFKKHSVLMLNLSIFLMLIFLIALIYGVIFYLQILNTPYVDIVGLFLAFLTIFPLYLIIFLICFVFFKYSLSNFKANKISKVSSIHVQTNNKKALMKILKIAAILTIIYLLILFSFGFEVLKELF